MANQTLFNKTISLVQIDEKEYFIGTRIVEYRWAVLFLPNENLKKTIAKIEVDLPYVSIPNTVFEQALSMLTN